jgi:hypothetical protein
VEDAYALASTKVFGTLLSRIRPVATREPHGRIAMRMQRRCNGEPSVFFALRLRHNELAIRARQSSDVSLFTRLRPTSLLNRLIEKRG